MFHQVWLTTDARDQAVQDWFLFSFCRSGSFLLYIHTHTHIYIRTYNCGLIPWCSSISLLTGVVYVYQDFVDPCMVPCTKTLYFVFISWISNLLYKHFVVYFSILLLMFCVNRSFFFFPFFFRIKDRTIFLLYNFFQATHATVAQVACDSLLLLCDKADTLLELYPNVPCKITHVWSLYPSIY